MTCYSIHRYWSFIYREYYPLYLNLSQFISFMEYTKFYVYNVTIKNLEYKNVNLSTKDKEIIKNIFIENIFQKYEKIILFDLCNDYKLDFDEKYLDSKIGNTLKLTGTWKKKRFRFLCYECFWWSLK